MNDLRTAAQQALEALQAYGSHAPNCDYLVLLTSLPPQRKPCSCGLGANITALRAALTQQAEPVKPVAWWYKDEPWFDGKRWHDNYSVTKEERVAKRTDPHARPLYFNPTTSNEV